MLPLLRDISHMKGYIQFTEDKYVKRGSSWYSDREHIESKTWSVSYYETCIYFLHKTFLQTCLL